MLVSVVIPSYNSEKHVINAINSVLKQTYTVFEIIVIDDGSKDDTKQIFENIDDTRVRYIYQENAGASAARNKGISLAEGEFIAFLDADDEWYPEKLEKQVNILKKNPNIGLNFCCVEKTDSKGNFLHIKKFKHDKNHKEIMKGMLVESFSNIIYPSTVIARKVLFEGQEGFDTRIIIAEDRDLWLTLGINAEFSCLNEPLVKHKKVDSSLTSTTNIKKHHKSYWISLEKFFKRQDLPEYLAKLKNTAYSSMYLELGILALLKTDGELDTVWKYVIKSFKTDPIGFISEYRKVKFLIRTIVNIIVFSVFKKVI